MLVDIHTARELSMAEAVEVVFSGAFAKLRKVSVSFVMTSRLSVSIEQLDHH